MLMTNQHLRRCLGAVLGVAAFVAASVMMAPGAHGQDLCELFGNCSAGSATTTTAPPPSSSTTAPPADGSSTTQPPTTDGSSTTVAPGGENPDGTDEVQPGTVPADAQAIINSVARSAPNSSTALLAAIEPLVEMGLSRDEAIRISFGAFPIAGDATFVHDWLFPRYGPGFRFHQGTDVFAAYGTPLRAVADGTLKATDGGLGGLSQRVVMPDGTYFYYTHLSALAEGYYEGQPVKAGDIIGYVGDSGNARGGSPHLHFGIYRNGTAHDPKPFLDQALADAMANLPNLIEQVRASLAEGGATNLGARRPRSLLATSLLRERANVTAAGVVTTETLYQTSGNPSAGGVAVVEHEAGRLAAVIDWSTRLLEPIVDPES